MHSRNIHFASRVSCFLFGPRGTGKTFWLRQCFPAATFVDLLAARAFNALSADPQRLEQILPASTEQPVIIDEIQKIPALLDEVHRLMESQRYYCMAANAANVLAPSKPSPSSKPCQSLANSSASKQQTPAQID